MEEIELENLLKLLDIYTAERSATGSRMVIDHNNKLLEDQEELIRFNFAFSWKMALAYHTANFTGNPNHFASKEDQLFTYQVLMNTMKDSLENTGNIDVLAIADKVKDNEDCSAIIAGLFSRKEHVMAVDNWGRLNCPDALERTEDYHTLEDAKFLKFIQEKKIVKKLTKK